MTGSRCSAGPGAADPGAELVEEVDPEGTVLRVVSRAEMRRDRLRHRCTYVVVLNRADEVLVHRRADWKDVYPGWWDLAFGGVCGVGEGWSDSAARELAEEAGLSAPLTDLGPIRYDGHDAAVVGRVFLARSEGPFAGTDGEVAETAWVARSDLERWARERRVCRDSGTAVLPLVVALE